jgi:hypothetical protein
MRWRTRIELRMHRGNFNGAVRHSLACWAAALSLIVAPSGCGASSPQADSNRPLEILVSADTAGWIVPCGCTTNQSGGLPRRGTLVAEVRGRGDVLVADAGGAAAGTKAYDRLKFAAILRGEAAMGVVAHNLGASEAALGADELRRLARELNAPFTSANLRDAAGAPVAEAARVATAAGRRVAFIGVVSPSLVPAGMQASPPRDAVLAALAGLDPRPDLVVVLAYLPEAELTALAEGLPEVDAVVGGPTGQSIAPRRLGPTLLTAVTNKGKFIADLKYTGRAGEASIVELSERYKDDERQMANVRTFYDELGKLDLAASETSFVTKTIADAPTEFSVAGTDACRRCHVEDAKSWDASPHGHAWQTLVAGGSHVDSYCQQCHVTSFGRAGGFVSALRSATLVNVGCESCHGPSSAHANTPTVPTGFGLAAKDQCTTCHDRENSPKFEYAAYWEQIVHGAAAVEKPTTSPAKTGAQ